MTSWIVTCELGTDYYDTLRVPCDDIVSAIDLACIDYHCVYKQVISVVRIEACY